MYGSPQRDLLGGPAQMVPHVPARVNLRTEP